MRPDAGHNRKWTVKHPTEPQEIVDAVSKYFNEHNTVPFAVGGGVSMANMSIAYDSTLQDFWMEHLDAAYWKTRRYRPTSKLT